MEEQEPHQEPQEEPVVKRRRVDSDQQSSPPKFERRNNSRIRIPAPCAPAINQITQELGLRSNGEAILWLIEQARPELVPPRQVPLKKLPRVVTNSNSGADPFPSPIPVAFAYPSGGDSVMNGKIMSLVPIENSGSGDSGVTETEVEAEEVVAVTEKTVRATVVQASTVFYDTKATLDKAERLIAGAAAYGSQLVVFPEAFVGGHPRFIYGVFDRSHLADKHSEFHKYHAAAIDVPGPEVDRLVEIAKKYKIHIVMGVVEREGLMLYSTLVFFDSKGQCLGKHRKLMPTSSEQMVWQAGNKPNAPVYKTSVGKIGGLICWDNRMPPLRTELYAKGIEIYCAPTADASDAWKASMTHLAVEGGCFVLSANQFCQRKDYPLPESYSVDSDKNLSPDSIVCAGGSVIISPSGAVLAGPNYQGESLISADLDLGEIARAKVDFDVVRHATSLGLIDRHLAPGSSKPN